MLYNQQISWRHLYGREGTSGGTNKGWRERGRGQVSLAVPHFHIAPMAAGGKSVYLSSAHTGCPKAVRKQEKMRTKRQK